MTKNTINYAHLFNLDDIDQACRPKNARFQAAKCVMLWFFGLERAIERVEMLGTEEYSCRIVIRRPDPAYRTRFAGQDQALQIAKREIMCGLAGTYADFRFTNGDDEQECFLDRLGEAICDEAYDFGDADDIKQAVSAAQDVYQDNRSAWHLFYTTAQWTEECLELPEVKTLVELLGNKLETRDVIEGDEIRSILSAGSDSGKTPLYKHLGGKWRQRFGVS